MRPPRRPLAPILLAGAAVLTVGGALAAFTALTARRAAASFPPLGTFVEVEGARLHVLDRGPREASGPPLLLIHGLAGQMGNFTHSLVDRLAETHRVLVVERPGSGWSDHARGGSHALRAQAALFAGLIARLGLERPLVVGHSLGGAVALALALDHPERVGGLALLAPLTQPVEGVSPVFAGLNIANPHLRRLVAWTIATPMSIARRTVAMETVFGPEACPHDFVERGGGMLGLRPRAFLAASADLLAAGDDLPGMVARYPSLAMPVGVLYGSQDRILDHELHGHDLLTQLPAAELEIIEGAGHMIPLTQPDRTAAFVRGMAARVTA